MGADSRGHTAQALWSAFARRTLWPDSRSGGPDLWRRLQCYPRFRDQGASVSPSVQSVIHRVCVCGRACGSPVQHTHTHTHYRARTTAHAHAHI